jgi:ACS family hexuronate transporter-like MFS transporter
MGSVTDSAFPSAKTFPADGTAKPTGVRWRILALLFFATTICYLDRIVFSVLAKEIKTDLNLSTEQYGDLQAAFQFAYTLGFLAMGKLIDRYGTRIGYAVAIVWWSLAAMMHAVARGPLVFGFWRAMLGLGEAGNFPAAIRAVGEWFPQRDRAFATGIFNAGSNVASMIGPPVFAWAALQYGWQACFVVTGSTGFIWLVLWLVYFRRPGEHRDVNAAELALIEEGAARWKLR